MNEKVEYSNKKDKLLLTKKKKDYSKDVVKNSEMKKRELGKRAFKVL